MQLVPSTEEVPAGSHTLAIYATEREAAEDVAGFLHSARSLGQSAIVFTSDESRLNLYQSAVARRAPQMADVFRLLADPYIRSTPEGLRPPEEALTFTQVHTRGASRVSDTLSRFLTRQNLADFIAFERWYDGLRAPPHRELCPYDLTQIPIDVVSPALNELSEAHSHAVLSDDPNPGVQLLQLLLVARAEDASSDQRLRIERARSRGVLERQGRGVGLTLTTRGENLVRALLTFPS